MDKISFTGYKNIAGYSLRYTNWDVSMHGVGFHLTNVEGKHAENYEKILRKYPAPFWMPAIKFEYIDKQFLPDGTVYRKDIFKLNDKELPLTDENLSIFEKLMRSLDDIRMSKKPFKLNKDYMDSADSFIEYQYSFGYPDADSFEEMSQYIHSPISIKKGIEQMQETVNRIMDDYYA